MLEVEFVRDLHDVKYLLNTNIELNKGRLAVE